MIQSSDSAIRIRNPQSRDFRGRFWQDRGEMTDSINSHADEPQEAGETQAGAASVFDIGGARDARDGSGATLDTVVETVRRILHADTASIASFSVADRTITWLAMSGFQNVQTSSGAV